MLLTTPMTTLFALVVVFLIMVSSITAVPSGTTSAVPSITSSGLTAGDASAMDSAFSVTEVLVYGSITITVILPLSPTSSISSEFTSTTASNFGIDPFIETATVTRQGASSTTTTTVQATVTQTISELTNATATGRCLWAQEDILTSCTTAVVATQSSAAARAVSNSYLTPFLRLWKSILGIWFSVID